MTVQNTPSFVDYIGDDVTLVFNFTFRVDDTAWLVVDFTDDFDTFAINLDQEANPGGSATYLVAPPSPGMGGPDPSFRVERIVPANQNLSYTRYDPFDSLSSENALDKLTMILQDQVTYIDAADAILTDGLAQEIIDRMAADVTLQGNIDAEAATRLANDNTEIALRIAGDAAVTAAYIAADNLLAADIAANTLLITTGGSPGHTHVLAEITDYVAPSGTVPAGSITGEFLRWNNGLVAWEVTPYLMPGADGGVGEVLTTDGFGNVTFQPGGGGGTPGGANTNIQFNNAGAFGGNSGLYWTDASNRLSISDDATGTLHISVGGNVATFDAFNLARFDLTSASEMRMTLSNAIIRLQESGGGFAGVASYGGYIADSASWTGVWAGYIDEAGLKWNLVDFDRHQFVFSQLTAAVDPSAGFMRWDNATPGSVTNLYIDDNDHAGQANHKWLSHLAVGDFIRMTDGITDSTVWYGTVSSTPTDNTGWWTVPVTTLFGNTRPISSNPVQLDINWLSKAPGGNPFASISITEQAGFPGGTVAEGLFWVRDRTVCQPWFTDDASVARPLAFAVARRVATNGSWDMNSGASDYNSINGIAVYDDGSAYSITTEDSGSLNWPIDCSFQVVARGAGVISILEGSGITLYVDDGSGFVDSAGGCTLTNGVATVYRTLAGEVRVWGSGLTP